MSLFQKGQIAWNKGKPFSDEIRKKMSLAKLGKIGKKHSLETRRKMSESHKGIKAGFLHPMYKGVSYMFGKHHSVGTRRKISLANKGRVGCMLNKHHTEETKNKMSLAHKGLKSIYKNKKIKIKLTEEQRRGLASLRARGNKYHLGKKHTEEARRKMSEKLKGHPSTKKGIPLPKETREKISATLKLLYATTDLRERISKAHMGIKQSEETKKKRSIKFLGSNNPCWNNGSSFKPYDPRFNQEFKEDIKSRDENICILCEMSNISIFVHHIDYNKGNTIKENCISLCNSCHSLTNHNRDSWVHFFYNLLSEKYGYVYDTKLEEKRVEWKEIYMH